jgi:hypothetical protein
MAKKKKRTRRSGGGAETQQRRQERLEARRKAKEEALRAQARRERRDRIVRVAVITSLLTALVWFIFFRSSTPESIAGHDLLSFSTDNGGQQTHQAPYSYDPETTGIDPPVSGRHNPNPAECGIHAEKIPDENFVHTLEHGAVAVVYRPTLDPTDIKEIEDIVSGYEDHTLSAPYEGLESPVVVASWSHKMLLDSVDRDAITEYIDTFRGEPPAPEAQQGCPNTADDPFQPKEAAPETSPTPDAGGEKEPGDEKGGKAEKEPGDDKGGQGEKEPGDDKGGGN